MSREFPVESVSRTVVSTMGEAGMLVFNLEDGGELAVRLPYELIADVQAALAQMQRSLVLKRQALGAGETPNAMRVASARGRDLPGGELHLQLNTENGIPFHFQLSGKLARELAAALAERASPAGRE